MIAAGSLLLIEPIRSKDLAATHPAIILLGHLIWCQLSFKRTSFLLNLQQLRECGLNETKQQCMQSL